MTRQELATAIQRLTVAWTEGDRESAELRSCDVIRGLAGATDGRPSRRDRHAAADALAAAYARVAATGAGSFTTRQAFLRAYIRAMTHWFESRLAEASVRRRPALTTTRYRRFSSGGAALVERLDRLHAKRHIDERDARLFLCNRILGVPQADLADLFTVDRRVVAQRIRAVSRLLGCDRDEAVPDLQ